MTTAPDQLIGKRLSGKFRIDAKLGVGLNFQDRAQEEGLLIRAIGDTIALCPPLIIVEVEIDELLGCFERALEATWTFVQALGPEAA